jgi:dGTPase
VVDELEERYPGFNGLNLTWELREGIIKHSSPYDAPTEVMAGFLPGVVPSIEGQIINYADEIAYNNHDIDDGLKSGYITLDMLEQITLWQRVSAGVREKYPAIDDRRLVFQTISAVISAAASPQTWNDCPSPPWMIFAESINRWPTSVKMSPCRIWS